MAVQRPQKTSGSRTFVDERIAGYPIIEAAEVDAEFDNLVNAVNTGNVVVPPLADLSVTTAKLANAPNGVTTAKLNDGAVTDPKIVSVSWAKVTGAPTSFAPTGGAGGVLNGSYPNPGFRNEAVDAAAIMDGEVTFSKLASNSVGVLAIINGAVDRAKLAANCWPNPIPTGADVGKVLTVGAGPALSWAAVAPPTIPDGSITDAKIVSVSYAKVTGAPTALPPTNNSVSTLSLQDLSVTAPKLANNAVTYRAIDLNSVPLPPVPNPGNVGQILSVIAGPTIAWINPPAGGGAGGTATGDISGTYPGPITVLKSTGAFDVGTNLRLTTAAGIISLNGSGGLGRIQTPANSILMSHNYNAATWDNAANSRWALKLDTSPGADVTTLYHAPPAGSLTALFAFQGDGRLRVTVDPSNALDLATKQYVDAHSGGGGGITDAPSDSQTYGRNNAAWVVVTGGSGGAGLVEWTWVASPPADPNALTAGQIGRNNATLSLVNAIYLHKLDKAGTDRSAILNAMTAGDVLSFGDTTGIVARYTITGKGLTGSVYSCSVTYVSSAGSGLGAGTTSAVEIALEGAVSGAAGGSLAGTYPNPTIAAGAVNTTELANNAVAGTKLQAGSVQPTKLNPAAVAGDVGKYVTIASTGAFAFVAAPGGAQWAIASNVIAPTDTTAWMIGIQNPVDASATNAAGVKITSYSDIQASNPPTLYFQRAKANGVPPAALSTLGCIEIYPAWSTGLYGRAAHMTWTSTETIGGAARGSNFQLGLCPTGSSAANSTLDFSNAGDLSFTGTTLTWSATRLQNASGYLDIITNVNGIAGSTFSKAIWSLRLDQTSDVFQVRRTGGSAGPSSVPFTVDANGTLTDIAAASGTPPILALGTGSSAVRFRIGSITPGNFQFYSNASMNNLKDDPALPSLAWVYDAPAQEFGFYGAPAGASITWSQLMALNAGGVVIPVALNPLTWGSRTVKGRLTAGNSLDYVEMTVNSNISAVQDDVAKPSWRMTLRADTDNFVVARQPPGGAFANQLAISATGVVTIASASISGTVTALGVTAQTFTSNVSNNCFKWGSGTVLGRLIQGNSSKRAEFTVNIDDVGATDDVTLPCWRIRLGSLTDDIQFNRHAAGPGAVVTLAKLDNVGNLTLAGKVVSTTVSGNPVASLNLGASAETLVMTFPSITTKGGNVLMTGCWGMYTTGAATGAMTCIFRIKRGATYIHNVTVTFPTNSTIPVPVPYFLDVAPAAGAYVYTITAQVTGNGIVYTRPTAGENGALWLQEI